MKSTIITLFTAVVGLSSANATTITAAGGTTGAQFVTSQGTFLTPTNSTVEVGSVSGNIFTKFALADTTPISFGTTASLQGRWLGNAADTSATATPFNSLQVWFRIITTADGGGFGVYGSTLNFPINGGGAADSLSVAGSTLTTLNSTLSQAGSAGFSTANPSFVNGAITIGVVPEPSAALLGALGALGLLRRRRI